MKAGKTEFKVGDRARIALIADPDDHHLLGMTGTVTHPFEGLMVGDKDQYIAGIEIDPECAQGVLTPDALGCFKINLMEGDKLLPESPEVERTFPAWLPKDHSYASRLVWEYLTDSADIVPTLLGRHQDRHAEQSELEWVCSCAQKEAKNPAEWSFPELMEYSSNIPLRLVSICRELSASECLDRKTKGLSF